MSKEAFHKNSISYGVWLHCGDCDRAYDFSDDLGAASTTTPYLDVGADVAAGNGSVVVSEWYIPVSFSWREKRETRSSDTPMGTPRPRARSIGGSRVVLYSPAKYEAYQEMLFQSALDLGIVLGGVVYLQFCMKMPESWSEKKKLEMCGAPCRSKPDADNLSKGVLDALSKNDERVWKLSSEKRWAREGGIVIRSMEE